MRRARLRSRVALPSLLLSVLAVASCGSPAPVDSGPCVGAALTKGPWSMRATATGASVFWETQSPGCVALGLAPEAGGPEIVVTGDEQQTTVSNSYGVGSVALPDVAGTYYVARVDLTALAPGTCYRWRTRSSGPPAQPSPATENSGRVCTAREASATAPWKFFAIGDTNPILGHTIPVLNHTLGEKPDFAIHMGDIHYYSSTETWAYWFKAMAPLLRTGAFFPSVGNHEDEAVDEPTDLADYYDRLFHRPSLDGDAGTGRWYRFTSGGIWFHTIDTEEPFDSGSAQVQWLVSSLKDAMAQPGFRFNVVYMHRPLYTLGDTSAQVGQRRDLAPIFASTKVRLVFAGHMHGYERFEVGDLTYLTTAGGGGTINDINAGIKTYPDDVPLRVAAAPAYHAMLVEVTPMGAATAVHGRAIDEHGTVIDEFTHVIP